MLPRRWHLQLGLEVLLLLLLLLGVLLLLLVRRQGLVLGLGQQLQVFRGVVGAGLLLLGLGLLPEGMHTRGGGRGQRGGSDDGRVRTKLPGSGQLFHVVPKPAVFLLVLGQHGIELLDGDLGLVQHAPQLRRLFPWPAAVG